MPTRIKIPKGWRRLRTKLTVPHGQDCPALSAVNRGDWDSPWYFPNGFREIKGTVRRDSIGRNAGRGIGEHWLVFRCNSHDGCPCKAEMLVALNDIFAAIPIGTTSRAKNPNQQQGGK